MRKSTNFNLNLVEGNDLVNPLVQDVPNYEAIDEQMYKNECNSIGIATELKSGTVHALTRTIPNASMFRFQATSNFTAGDTLTVDGIQVSALTPSGETLASGAYIIGSEVLCSLRETLLTIYTSGGVVVTASDSERLGGNLPTYYATKEEAETALSVAQASNTIALGAQEDVQELQQTVESINDWKYLGQFTGKNTFSFESIKNQAREIRIVSAITSGTAQASSYIGYIEFPANIYDLANSIIANTSNYVRLTGNGGVSRSDNKTEGSYYHVTTNSVQLYNYFHANEDLASYMTSKIYYR